MNHLPKENIYGHTKKLKYIIEQVNIYFSSHAKPIKILDFGCGNGSAVSRFLIREGLQYYGVDIHEPSISYAKMHYESENTKFFDRIPRGVMFDIIIYSDVLEHLDDPSFVLKQHYQILKDDGIIIGAIPNGFGPFENEKRIDRILGLTTSLVLLSKIKRKLLRKSSPKPTNPPYNFESGHVQFFTKRKLFRTIEECGLKIDSFKKGSFLGAPFSEQFFLRGNFIINLNTRIADYLPYWAVSGWYFKAMKRDK